MKKIKLILKALFFVIVVSLLLFIGSMFIYPEETSQFIGYRFFTVLTDSMEPRIPTYSVVCSKVITEKEPLDLKKGDIITFKANRLGEDIIITHHFNKMQANDKGEMFYRTNAEGKENLDLYETRRSDIIGRYVFHIPYAGKIILFLKSPFGLIMYGELFIIWLVNKVVKARWKEKESEQKKKTLEELAKAEQDALNVIPAKEQEEPVEKPLLDVAYYISDIRIEQQGKQCEVYAVIHNHTKESKQNIFVELTLYDKQYQKKKRYVICTAKHAMVQPNQTHSFCFRFHCDDELVYYTMKIL